MSSDDLKSLIQDFEKNQKAICQIVYFQPLQNQTSKLSLKDFHNSKCCIDFWINGRENFMEYSFPNHSDDLAKELMEVFVETNFPKHSVPISQQIEFIWESYKAVYEKHFKENGNSMNNIKSETNNLNEFSSSKKPSMKTTRDVINRFKWDDQLDVDAVVVGYLDRFLGTVESSFDLFDWDSDLSSVDASTLAIPQHRIQYFKYNQEIVWDKSRRYDSVFGSSGSSRTLVDVIKDQKDKKSEKVMKNENEKKELQETSSILKSLLKKKSLNKHEVRISKALTAALRHNKFGFEVGDDGFLLIDDIVQQAHFKNTLHATDEVIHKIVDLNDKKRFEIITNENGKKKIRALQGHSIKVEKLNLQEIKDFQLYSTLVHGTYKKFWKSISEKGLHRRQRNHIHLTTSLPGVSNDVISGMRSTCDLFIYIDLEKSLKDGLKFYVSLNGVVLCPGDEHGFISTKYFKDVQFKEDIN